MTRSATERADFVFAVKEHGDHSPFIMLEPQSEGLKSLGSGFLSLELQDGVTMEQAKALAERLNSAVARVSHTKLSG